MAVFNFALFSLFTSCVYSAVVPRAIGIVDVVLPNVMSYANPGAVASLSHEMQLRGADYPDWFIQQPIIKVRKFQTLEFFPQNVRTNSGRIPQYLMQEIAGWHENERRVLAACVLYDGQTNEQAVLLQRAYHAAYGPSANVPMGPLSTLDAIGPGPIKDQLVRDILDTNLPENQMRRFLRAYTICRGDEMTFWNAAEITAFQALPRNQQMNLIKIALLGNIPPSQNTVFDIEIEVLARGIAPGN